MRNFIKWIVPALALLTIGAGTIYAEAIDEDQPPVKKTRTVKTTVNKDPVVKPLIDSSYDDYRIGIDDVLTISVYPDESLSAVVTVGFDGRIGVPKIGEFKAEGKTTTDLDGEITRTLKKYLKNPDVVVSVKEFRSRKVLVFGRVSRSGSLILAPATRLLQILTLAGFDQDNSDIENIAVIHANGEREVANLRKVIEEGDVTQNLVLKPNDTVYVPDKPKPVTFMVSGSTSSTTEAVTGTGMASAEMQTIDEEKKLAYIYVFGEAKKPGKIEYDLDGDIMTVKQALTLAGWYAEKANLDGAKVIRANNIQEPVNLNRLIFQADLSQDLILYQGDSLFIPESKEAGVYILGHIKKPGFFRITKGMTILQALTLANHERFGARLKDTKLVRGWPNRPAVYSVNLEKLLYRGDLRQNIELKDGDVIFVPETTLSYSLDFWNRLLGPITGGVSLGSKIELLSQPGAELITKD